MFHVLDDELNDSLDREADSCISDDQFFKQMGQKETHLLADDVVQRFICSGIRVDSLQEVQ